MDLQRELDAFAHLPEWEDLSAGGWPDREKYLLELLRKASVFIPASPLSMEIEAVLLRSADEHH
jgi:hypothetical protein